jgi:hypothetical protein
VIELIQFPPGLNGYPSFAGRGRRQRDTRPVRAAASVLALAERARRIAVRALAHATAHPELAPPLDARSRAIVARLADHREPRAASAIATEAAGADHVVAAGFARQDDRDAAIARAPETVRARPLRAARFAPTERGSARPRDAVEARSAVHGEAARVTVGAALGAAAARTLQRPPAIEVVSAVSSRVARDAGAAAPTPKRPGAADGMRARVSEAGQPPTDPRTTRWPVAPARPVARAHALLAEVASASERYGAQEHAPTGVGPGVGSDEGSRVPSTTFRMPLEARGRRGRVERNASGFDRFHQGSPPVVGGECIEQARVRRWAAHERGPALAQHGFLDALTEPEASEQPRDIVWVAARGRTGVAHHLAVRYTAVGRQRAHVAARHGDRYRQTTEQAARSTDREAGSGPASRVDRCHSHQTRGRPASRPVAEHAIKQVLS